MPVFSFLKKSKKPQGKEQNQEQSIKDICEDVYDKSVAICFDVGQASVSMLQRRLHLEYKEAAGIIECMERLGVVSTFDGTKPRSILITKSQYIRNRDIYRPSAFELNSEKHPPKPSIDISCVDNMSGPDFERWCAYLLKNNGFNEVDVTKGSGDQGVDVLAEKDGIRYAIQCKCYSSDLGNTPVQEVHTGKTIYRCHVGVVMTNRYFTAGAKEAADATGVLLWDRDTLMRMMKNIEKATV